MSDLIEAAEKVKERWQIRMPADSRDCIVLLNGVEVERFDSPGAAMKYIKENEWTLDQSKLQ